MFCFFIRGNCFQGFFRACFDAFWFASTEIACRSLAGIGMYCNSSMVTSLDAPVAAFTLFFLEHYYASIFRLNQSFFRTSFNTFSIFAESASECEIEQRRHANDANAGAYWVPDCFAFLQSAGIFANSAASTLTWVN